MLSKTISGVFGDSLSKSNCLDLMTRVRKTGSFKVCVGLGHHSDNFHFPYSQLGVGSLSKKNLPVSDFLKSKSRLQAPCSAEQTPSNASTLT